jgi:hypothetical protein
LDPEIILAFVLLDRTILGSDPGTAVFMFDANYDPNNNDDDELAWFPIDDLELFLV